MEWENCGCLENNEAARIGLGNCTEGRSHVPPHLPPLLKFVATNKWANIEFNFIS